MPSQPARSLDSLFSDVAGSLGDVEATNVGETTEYGRSGGHVFAAVSDDTTVELRLHPDVADAARRTPGTSASPRGADWVCFTPRTLEGHDRDRLEAWFRSAWRAAAGSRAK